MKRLSFISFLFLFLYSFFASPAYAIVSVEPLFDMDVTGAPSRLAVGVDGKVYVSDTQARAINVYSNNGVLLRSIAGVQRPIAIDVDNAGNVYVGDASTGSVMVFDSSGSFVKKLGVGDGEFQLPSDLVVTSAGDVYVTDAQAGVIKAFTSASDFTFGAGTLINPSGIAVDETVSPAELYVIDDDDGTGSIWGNRYVRKYALNGSLLGNISLGGAFGTQKVIRPTGLTLDATRLYVVDGYQSGIVVMSKAGAVEMKDVDGVLVPNILGTLGTGFGEFDVPTDLEFDPAGKMFVADYNNTRIDVFGVTSETGSSDAFTVSPSSIEFTLKNSDSVAHQTVIIESNPSGIDWTAQSTAPWLGISFPSGSTPDTLIVTVRATGLSTGAYIGFVEITTSDGIVHVVKVKLTVDLRVALEVAPQAVSFEYQMGAAGFGEDYPEQTILIYSSGESVAWKAATSEEWLTLSAYTGITPASITVRINRKAEDLDVETVGSFAGKITIFAGDIPGSPAEVSASLEVHEAGNVSVSSNLSEAGFVLDGPDTFAGSGASWSFENIPPGEYAIFFTHVSGYIRPPSQSFTVHSGETVAVDGFYRDALVENALVAVSGMPGTTTADIVDFNGHYRGSLVFLQELSEPTRELDFTTGDFDGNGLSEVAFTDGSSTVEIYTAWNVPFKTMNFSDAMSLRLAAADIDNDGRDDLLISSRKGSGAQVGCYGLNSTGFWVRKCLSDTIRGTWGFDVASGDINGDGITELLLAGRNIEAFDMSDGIALEEIWETVNPGFGSPNIAVGDLDGDGIDEIVAGHTGRGAGSQVRVYAGDGTELFTFDAFGDLGYDGGVFVTTADLNGDFVEEILVGAGPEEGVPSLVRVFLGDGTFTGITIDILEMPSYGARIKAGRF